MDNLESDFIIIRACKRNTPYILGSERFPLQMIIISVNDSTKMSLSVLSSYHNSTHGEILQIDKKSHVDWKD